MLVVATSGTGFALGSGSTIDLAGLCWTCTGTMMVAASANSLNQVRGSIFCYVIKHVVRCWYFTDFSPPVVWDKQWCQNEANNAKTSAFWQNFGTPCCHLGIFCWCCWHCFIGMEGDPINFFSIAASPFLYHLCDFLWAERLIVEFDDKVFAG